MKRAIAVVIVKDDKIIALKESGNKVPIIAIKNGQEKDEVISKWFDNNLKLENYSKIECEETLRESGYDLDIVFIDVKDDIVEFLEEDKFILTNINTLNMYNKIESHQIRIFNTLLKEAAKQKYSSLGINEINFLLYHKIRINKERAEISNIKKVEIILFSIIIGILSAIFFFNYAGISVGVFVAVLIIAYFTICGVKKKDLFGFIFLISGFLLSCTYGIYTNPVFRLINFLLIPLLIGLGFLILSFPEVKIQFITLFENYCEKIIGDTFAGTFHIGKVMKDLNISQKEKKDNGKLSLIFKGLILSIPVLIVLTFILASADQMFSYYLFKILDGIIPENLFDILTKGITVVLGFLISFGLFYELTDTNKTIRQPNEINKTLEPILIATVLSMVTILYTVFSFIQGAFLYGDKVLPQGMTYSSYAREGFFQLVALVVVNIIIIIFLKLKTKSENKKIEIILNCIYSAVTLITCNMAIASMFKMNLYMDAFGVTRLRVLVQAFTIFLLITMIFLIFYVWKKYNILKPIIITSLFIYLGLNYGNLDKYIAIQNINNKPEVTDVDIDYLTTLSLDSYEVMDKGLKDGKISEDIYKWWRENNIMVEDFKWNEFNYIVYRINKEQK